MMASGGPLHPAMACPAAICAIRCLGVAPEAPAQPIVDHKAARARALAAYDVMRESGRPS